MIKKAALIFILAFSIGLSSSIVLKPKKSCAQFTDCITALAEVISFEGLLQTGLSRLLNEALEKSKELVKNTIKSAMDLQVKLDVNLSAIKASIKNIELPKMRISLKETELQREKIQDRKQAITKTTMDSKFDTLECSTASATATAPIATQASLEVSRFSRVTTNNCISRASEECRSPAREIASESDTLRMATATQPANDGDVEGGAYSDFSCPTAPSDPTVQTSYQNFVNKYLYGGMLMVDAIRPNPYAGQTLGGGASDPAICSTPLKASQFSDLWQKQVKYVINGAVGRDSFPADAFNANAGREAYLRAKSYDTQLSQLYSFKNWYLPKITPTMNNGQRLRAILRTNTGLAEPAQKALNSLDRGDPCPASDVGSYPSVLEYVNAGNDEITGCDGEAYAVTKDGMQLLEYIEETYDRDQLSEKEFMDIMMSKRFQGSNWVTSMNNASSGAIKRNTNNLMAFRLMQQRETHELLEFATLFAAIKVARRIGGGSSRGQIAGMIQDLLPEGHKYANKDDILKATETVTAAKNDGKSPDDFIEELYKSMR